MVGVANDVEARNGLMVDEGVDDNVKGELMVGGGDDVRNQFLRRFPTDTATMFNL